MARPTRIGAANILAAAVTALCERGAASLTLDTVSNQARCAKGLVHYHFSSRRRLLTSASDSIWDQREEEWRTALTGAAEDCIRQSWKVLLRESAGGVTRAWLSLAVDSDHAVAEATKRRLARFDTTLQSATMALLDSLGLIPTIPPDEWCRVLAAAIHGISVQLEGGSGGAHLEGAYSAVWLAALSLTQAKVS